MYIYFDSNGTLKEIITERPFRVGDVKRNKIYVYWDGEHAPASGWVKYRKPDGTDTTETSFFAYGQNLVEKELPQTPVRNLKYFSYDHTYVKDGVTKVGYQFYEITVPNEVLNSSSDNTDLIPTENNMVVARIRFVMVDSGTIGEIDDSDTIETLGAVVFSVETNMGIITDSSIDETQYNYLLWAIGNKVDTSALITALNNKADRNNPSQTIVADRIVTDNITDDENSTYGLDIIENTTPDSEQFKFEYMGELKIELDAGLQEMRLNNGFENTGIEIGENIKLNAPHIYNGANQELATQDYVNSNVGTATQNALDLKVDKSSIVDNTTTNDATKVLSAKQGKVLRDDLGTETANRQSADNNLQSQIDGINAGQNLADIVADLTALGNLDTTKLQSGDKVEVLSDSNHDNVSTVYNWNGTAFVYIGAYGMDSYTKAQMDTYLANKQDKIDSSHKLSSDLVDDTGHTNKFVTEAQKIKIDNAYGPKCFKEDTSTNILAKTYDTGLYIASDNGHWYYWNGSAYVDGGLQYLMRINNNSIGIENINFKDCLGLYAKPNSEVSYTSENQYYYINNDYKITYNTSLSNFYVYVFPVTANTPYIIKGNVSLGGNYPLVGFKTTPDVSGTNNTQQEIILNGTSTLTYYETTYTPLQNGYLFVAYVTGPTHIGSELLKVYSANILSSLDDKMKLIDEIYYPNISITDGWELGYYNSSGNKAYYSNYCNNKFEVKKGMTISVSGILGVGGTAAAISGILLDSNNNMLEVITTQLQYTYIVTNDNAKYFAVCNSDINNVSDVSITISKSSLLSDLRAQLQSDFSDKVIYTLGDSITWFSNSWAFNLAQNIKCKKVYNLARGGANFALATDGYVYDDTCAIWNNPFVYNTSDDGKTESYPSNIDNTCNAPIIDTSYAELPNQIRFMDRLITEYDRPSPDIIIVACGVNDTNQYAQTYSDAAFNEIIDTPLADMTAQQIATLGGGIRWCIGTLMTKYPNAEIMIATPIQSDYGYIRPYFENTIKWIMKFREYYSLKLIDAFNESGISRAFEKGHNDMSYVNQNAGRYLYDGLHPNDAGKKLMSYYFAKRIFELHCNIK